MRHIAHQKELGSRTLLAALGVIIMAVILIGLTGCAGIDTKYYSGNFCDENGCKVWKSEKRLPVNFSHNGKHLTGTVIQACTTRFVPAESKK